MNTQISSSKLMDNDQADLNGTFASFEHLSVSCHSAGCGPTLHLALTSPRWSRFAHACSNPLLYCYWMTEFDPAEHGQLGTGERADQANASRLLPALTQHGGGARKHDMLVSFNRLWDVVQPPAVPESYDGSGCKQWAPHYSVFMSWSANTLEHFLQDVGHCDFLDEHAFNSKRCLLISTSQSSLPWCLFV